MQLALLLACGPRGVPKVAAEAEAPIPYSAAQIRDSFELGLEIDWTIHGKESRWRVVEHRDDGLTLWADGQVSRSSWEELRSHASFPAGSTTLEEVILDGPLGSLPAWRYRVSDVDVTKWYWFGKDTPGAPLKHTMESGTNEIFFMEQTRREVVPASSEVMRVSSGAADLWTRSEGTGDVPLVMVHGGPGMTSFPFEVGVGPMLAASQKVIYTDYRGAGRSSRPEGTEHYSFSILADDVEAIRRAHQAEQIVLFGHSNGGATAITYAAKHPERVKALILVAPLLSAADLEANVVNKALGHTAEDRAEALRILQRGGPISERFVAILEALPAEDRHALQFASESGQQRFDSAMARFKMESGVRQNMSPDLIGGLRESGFFTFDAYSHLETLTMPVLVVVGREDREISHDNARRFAMSVSGDFLQIPDSGHHPFIEQPETLANGIQDFLTGL